MKRWISFSDECWMQVETEASTIDEFLASVPRKADGEDRYFYYGDSWYSSYGIAFDDGFEM